MRGSKFQIDRVNGKLFGVCAGLARYTGWDVTWIRVGAVLVTLMGAFPWTVIAYGAAAFFARPRDRGLATAGKAPALRTSARAFRESTRDIDRRLAEVETYVASANGGLAREIESLR